jgi:type II secretory pathway pseudopilin PulG
MRQFDAMRRRSGHLRPDAGFSIVELIISLTLFSLVVGSLVTLIATGLSVARNNKDRSVAAHLASEEMDAIRQKTFSTLGIGQTVRRVTVNSVRYKLTDDVEWASNAATSSACDSTGSSPRVLRVTVSVTWPNMRNVDPVKTSTEISPPVGSYDPDNGHVAVRVHDRDGAPIGSVPVRVVGSGYDQTQTTIDDTGCAFFGFLVPGTYSVTLGTSGWVDRQSNATPSQSVGVTASNVTSVAFDYDEAATMTATLTPNHGGVPANAVPVTLANTALLPSGSRSYPGVGIVRSLANLFPFADGYQAWAGDCADADPEGRNASGTAYWPGAQRDNAISVDPGGTVAAAITLQTVHVEFESESDHGVVALVAVHAPDGMCSGGSTLNLGTASGQAGDLLVGLPFGTWTIQAVGQSPEGRWDSAVLDPGRSSTQDVTVHIR